MKHYYQLGVIGYGNMADAILNGAISLNACKIEEICIYDINNEKITEAKNKGFATAEKISDITENCKYVFLSIKPQSAEEVFENLKNFLHDNIFISIMAGITKEKIHNALKNIKVCRCMPNTPALIGKGVTAIDASEINSTDKVFIINLFNSVGQTLEIEEKYMNAVTAVSGSGPAFVYKFIGAYIEAAKNIGLSEKNAEKLVLHTVTGAAEMINQRDTEINTLINRVCSKGGTTIEGINTLEKNHFDKIINECVNAAYKRAEELSKL